jgi:hypothetical protein
MEYLDFEVAIEAGTAGDFRVSVIRSPCGETRETTRFPFDQDQLNARLSALRETLLRARGSRTAPPTPAEATEAGLRATRAFGQELFEVLFTGEVGHLYVESLKEARRKPNRGLRVKLRAQGPELAALPWEFLLDDRRGDFICLSNTTPLVRYLESPNPPEALTVTLPLRILGVIASPSDLPTLDVAREKQRMEEALAESRRLGRVEITWLSGETWQALTHAMGGGGGGPWHIVHFIGHGGFDRQANEGYLVLAGETGESYRLKAMGLSRLLGDHASLRLVVLNACEGAKGSGEDLFSSTAGILVRRGLPAVVSMQQEISDQAAIEFGRQFYQSLSAGAPVDAAVAEGRKAVSLALPSSIEWATPVLHMRAPDGALFTVAPESRPVAPAVRRPGLGRRIGLIVAAVLGLAVLGFGALKVLGGRRAAALDHLFINRSSATLLPGDTFHDYVVGVREVREQNDDIGELTWSNSNEQAAIRSSSGYVRALAPGRTTIAARTADGLVASTTVTVQLPVASVEIEPRTVTLGLGKSFTFRATIKDANGEFILDQERSPRWRSSNDTIVSVSLSGRATAYAPGTALIEARIEGKAAVARVTVPPASAPSPSPSPPPSPSPQRCTISGLVFDSDANKPLPAVWVDVYRDISQQRPQQLKAGVATTGPDGRFSLDCGWVEGTQFPLLLAFRHADWVATRITGQRIERAGEWSGINIPISMSSVQLQPLRELQVSFTRRQTGADYFVVGEVENRSGRSFPCVRIRFNMVERVAGQPARTVGILDVELRNIRPNEKRPYEKQLPGGAVGFGLHSKEECS